MRNDNLSTRYRRIAEDLRSWITSGILPPGTKMPTESQLMRLYDVSRVTVRLAVGMLRQEGLVTTRHGQGSFVR